MRNDVLIISYNFPPYWSSGTIRVAKLVKYLPQFGWRPIVITCRRRFYDAGLRTPMDDYAEAKIIRVPLNLLDWFEGFKNLLKPIVKPILAKQTTRKKSAEAAAAPFVSNVPTHHMIYKHSLAAKIARVLFPIDQYIVWGPAAFVASLWTLWRNPQIRRLLVSGPPFSQVWVGALLSKLFPRLQLIADFRDSWLEDINRYYPTAFHERLEKAAERFVIRQASVVTLVADDFLPLFKQKYSLNGKMHLLHNGFDEDDFQSAVALPKHKRFEIEYFGGIGEGRNISGLLRAVSQLKLEGRITPDTFRLNFHGSVHPFFKQETKILHTDDLVQFFTRIPYREVLAKMPASSVLLLVFENDPNGGFYTTKFFEYLYARRPILVIGPARGAGRFIQDHGIGQCVLEDDVEGLKQALLSLMEKHALGQLPDHSVDINLFSRERIAATMATLFSSSCTK